MGDCQRCNGNGACFDGEVCVQCDGTGVDPRDVEIAELRAEVERLRSHLDATIVKYERLVETLREVIARAEPLLPVLLALRGESGDE